MLKIVFSSSDLLLLKDEKISIEEYKEKNKIKDLQKESKGVQITRSIQCIWCLPCFIKKKFKKRYKYYIE